MNKLLANLLPALLLVIVSCTSKPANTYAIKDFSESLQPFLLEIAVKGFVTTHDYSKMKAITDDELKLLAKSENPVLRATALEEITDRASFNKFLVVRDNLTDTAIVAIDQGEFGYGLSTVADYLLRRTRLESPEEETAIIEAVITKHNYLETAYTKLHELDAVDEYYPFIRDMAMRPRNYDPYEGRELGFSDIEYALYGLAKFKKKEDVPIIKKRLTDHVWDLGYVSFQLMKEFPDTSYFDILQTYHRRTFYRFSGNRPHGFSGVVADKASPEDFIFALVAQQSNRSAMLLDTILTNLPKYECFPGKDYVINETILQIWRHPSPVYATLREKYRHEAVKIIKGRVIDYIDTIPVSAEERK